MPRRKGNNVQPRFSFVNPQNDPITARASHTRTSAVRRHAAYWGGPMRHSRNYVAGATEIMSMTSLANGQGQVSTESMHAANEEQTKLSRIVRPRKIQPIPEMTNRYGSYSPGERTQSLLFSIVCPLPRGLDSVALLLGDWSCSESPMTGTFGRTLIGRFTVPYQWTSSVFMAGCMLLTTAQTMAVTGKGTRADLLELKAQVLRSISRNISRASGPPSLECMAVGTLLCSPIVCLLSQDLPNGLSFGKYVEASTQGIHVCCPEAATAAKIATCERKVHWRHLLKFSSEVERSDQQAEQIELFRYLYRSTAISIILDTDGSSETVSDDVVDLHSTWNTSDQTAPTPTCWISPLTAHYVDKIPTLDVESPTDALAELTRDWLATLLDEYGEETEPNADLLQQRLWFRQRLERFACPRGNINTLEDAIYACCWWATTVLLKADRFRISLAFAAEQTKMQPRLVSCLRMTDLTNLWGPRRGLLFWVISVCHLATTGRCLPVLTTALYAHFAHEMASDVALYHIGMGQLRRLQGFERLCCWTVPPRPSTVTRKDL